MSPDEIQQALAAMDRMRPLQMTDAELAAWSTVRRRKAGKKRTSLCTPRDFTGCGNRCRRYLLDSGIAADYN